MLAGNENNYLAVKRHLVPPIFATKVRVLPYSIYARTVCMRVEIHGCNKTGKPSRNWPAWISEALQFTMSLEVSQFHADLHVRLDYATQPVE